MLGGVVNQLKSARKKYTDVLYFQHPSLTPQSTERCCWKVQKEQ